jgi:hypothetical protein
MTLVPCGAYTQSGNARARARVRFAPYVALRPGPLPTRAVSARPRSAQGASRRGSDSCCHASKARQLGTHGSSCRASLAELCNVHGAPLSLAVPSAVSMPPLLPGRTSAILSYHRSSLQVDQPQQHNKEVTRLSAYKELQHVVCDKELQHALNNNLDNSVSPASSSRSTL